ncbi:MAG TPA: hypothetical protein VFA96_07435 [Nocardioides sp.]|nr:hypothetical protein [Nocardioides sp.]
MTRTMIDGVNTDAPRMPTTGIQLVAGYVDGLYAWSQDNWDRFPPGVIRVHIAVFSTTNDGHVLDVEPGNATPAQAVDWVLMRRGAGADPTIYCSVSNWPVLRAAFAARDVPEPHWWLAAYDDVAVIPAGTVAKQYNDDLHLHQPYDISVVADYWPGVDSADPPSNHGSVRRNDMHIPLKPGDPVVFTNPAAALGGTSRMLVASDFGDLKIRIATYSWATKGWTVHDEVSVDSKSPAYALDLPPDTNKVSVGVDADSTGIGGLVVLA